MKNFQENSVVVSLISLVFAFGGLFNPLITLAGLMWGLTLFLRNKSLQAALDLLLAVLALSIPVFGGVALLGAALEYTWAVAQDSLAD